MPAQMPMRHDVNAPQTIYRKNYQVPTHLIDDIHLQIDLNDDVTVVKSVMQIRQNRLSTSKAKQLKLHGEALQLESITLNGERLAADRYVVSEPYLIINDVPEKFTLEIVNKIYPQLNTALSGLYRSGNTYCTQCEAEGFRRITYFIDQPDILSRYTTTITADATRYPFLLSNGNLIASGEHAGNRHFATWEDPFNKPSYLFALVAGDFDVLSDVFVTQSGREISLKLYVEKGYGDQAQHALYAVKRAMAWDEQAYGREYDLDIYMIVAISDFNMGAMENKGLNIFNTKYVLAKPATATDDDYIHILSVVGHEYFHNWSGNRVTCRDWFQLSLKEGLTIFRDQSFTEDELSRGVMRIRDVIALRESQFPEDAGPLAHPVRPESYIEINNFYTATIYNKGAEVLRMLQTMLGKPLFRKGMDVYFAQFDGQAVTIEDFVKTMEDISGMDLRQFRLWYSQAGTPIVSVDDDYDEHKKRYTLTIRQSTPATPGQETKEALHIPIRLALLNAAGNTMPLSANGETEQVLHLTEAAQSFQFDHIASRPIPSLLRDFSAPVKLHYPYADEDLVRLVTHDSDAFNRFEAAQTYAMRVMLNLIRDYQQDNPLEVPTTYINMIRKLLTTPTTDHFLLAEMLILPSEKYIGQQMACVDVDAIHDVREFVLMTLAQQLQADWLQCYHAHHDASGQYQFDLNAIGSRQLKNRCLAYLLMLPQHAALGAQQFAAALHHNMTDTQAALTALANLDSPLRDKALAEFKQVWQDDALVMDKWFAIQASSKLPDALQQVKKLMRDPNFDLKNPNKVYALIGTFGQRNLVNFHSRNGEGYAFLSETVQQLDKLNPQVAARMVNPLTTWKRYDKERQQLMRTQLEMMLQSAKLSPDLYEIVSKSLEG